MKFCEFCGAPMEDAHVFCMKCGKKEVPAAPPTPPPMPQMPPVQAPIQQTQPVYQQTSSNQVQNVSEKKAKKSSKAPIIVAICGSLAVVGVTIGLLFGMGIISFSGKDEEKLAAVNIATPLPEAEPTAAPVTEPTEEPAPEEEQVTEDQTEDDNMVYGDADDDQTADDQKFDESETEDDYYEDDEESESWSEKHYDSYIYPSGSTVYELDSKWLTKKDIRKILKLKELKGLNKYNKISVVLNSMYAVHGYIFGSKKSKNPNKAMLRFFETREWYYGETDDLNSAESGFNRTEIHNRDILAKCRNKYSSKNAQEKLDEFLDDVE